MDVRDGEKSIYLSNAKFMTVTTYLVAAFVLLRPISSSSIQIVAPSVPLIALTRLMACRLLDAP